MRVGRVLPGEVAPGGYLLRADTVYGEGERMRVRLAALAAVGALATLAAAAPSGATVHEIIGQWCAGKGELGPPGISDPTRPTFARPLIASGVVSIVPFNGGILFQFDFDHPAIKVVPAGAPVQLAPGVWITPWTTDDDFPAFRNCPGYVTTSFP